MLMALVVAVGAVVAVEVVPEGGDAAGPVKSWMMASSTTRADVPAEAKITVMMKERLRWTSLTTTRRLWTPDLMRH